MDAKELIRQGNLLGARAAVVEAIKADPGSVPKRTLFFQILAFLGEWDKAETQLEILWTQDPQRKAGYGFYRELVQMERQREAVLAGHQAPSYFPEPPSYAEIYEKAIHAMTEQDMETASDRFRQMDAMRPHVRGSLNGQPFEGIADTDTRLGACLEMMVYGRYLWVPFEKIRAISLPPPKTLLDTLWAPAHLTTWEGLDVSCCLPVLYPMSHQHDNDMVKLGRQSEWIPLGQGCYRAVGQHVYQLGSKEIALMEIREATFLLSPHPSEEEKGVGSDGA